MRRFVLLLLTTLILLGATGSRIVYAQTRVTNTWVVYDFGEKITFLAELQSDLPIETAIIFFQATNDTHTNVGLASVEPLEDGKYKLTYVHHLDDYTLRAFSHVGYRFEIAPKGGDVYRSPIAQFYYEDNRLNWNTLEESPFKVHWHEGDIQFAQSVLDVTQSGLKEIHQLIPLAAPKSLEIYIYSDTKMLQDTLHPSSENWIAGHTDPDLGIIVVELPSGPEQRLLMEQRIPHELMHVLLYQSTDLGYTNLPTWLNEGLASLAELYPNPDHRILLDNAIQRDSLLPISSLCKTFPRDASNALLSYAQSASFTRYLHDTYGTSGLQALVTHYANGLDCEHGAQVALGKSLTQLERQWRRDALAENIALSALNNLLPWLTLLVAVLVAPIGLLIYRLRQRAIGRPASSQAS